MVVRPMCLTFSIPGICVDGWWGGVERQCQGSDGVGWVMIGACESASTAAWRKYRRRASTLYANDS